MLLTGFKITYVLPCLADPEKIRVIVGLSDNIHEVLPYLNATIKGAIYHHQASILTLKEDGVMITLYPQQAALVEVKNEAHAHEIMEWLRRLLNETYENRKSIQPSCERGVTLKALDVFKLLPGIIASAAGS